MDPQPNWTPLALISDSGLWLGATGEEWVVGRLNSDSPVAVAREARALLVLLERDWAVARHELAEAEAQRPDLGPISMTPAMRLALAGQSSRWTELALQWCVDGFDAHEFVQQIEALAVDRHLSQHGRHLAAKVLRAAR